MATSDVFAASSGSTAETMDGCIAALCEEFRTAGARMKDLPIYNPALAVEAVGFHEWEDNWLGVMITPWFINLVLIPRNPDAMRDHRPGDKVSWTFPAGQCRFIVSFGAECGPYQSCSLFSPVLEFANPEAARLAAGAALATLLRTQGEPGESDPPTVHRRQVLRGRLSRPTSL